MRKGCAWTMIICLILIAVIIISLFAYLGKEVKDHVNADWGLDTTESTMTPEEEAEYYNHDTYNNQVAAMRTAGKTIGTVVIIAVIAIVIVVVKEKGKRL